MVSPQGIRRTEKLKTLDDLKYQPLSWSVSDGRISVAGQVSGDIDKVTIKGVNVRVRSTLERVFPLRDVHVAC